MFLRLDEPSEDKKQTQKCFSAFDAVIESLASVFSPQTLNLNHNPQTPTHNNSGQLFVTAPPQTLDQPLP
jgi:hypothetical protein